MPRRATVKKTTAKKTAVKKKKVNPFDEPYKGMSKAPGAKCDLCPLREYPMVPGFGPAKAQIVLVGEAPGKDEVLQKKPFVGKSGQLMNQVLKYHGIKREEVFVTNACLCRPPGNKTPNTVAVRACRDRLVKEVASRNSDYIIAAGAVAAKAVLDSKEGITKLRIGGAKTAKDFGKSKVVPTFHPAAALRSPDYFPSIINDVKKIHVHVGWEPTNYKVIEGDAERASRMLLKQVESSKKLTIDVETDHHASHSRLDPTWLCIGVSHRPGAAVVYDQQLCNDPKFQRVLAKVLADKKLSWGYHRGKFDIQALWSFAPGARVDEDTLLAHYMTDERKGTHDLEQVLTEKLGAPNYKTEMRKYLPNDEAPLSLLPKDILHRYNAMDVDGTHRLLDPLHEEMESDGTMRAYRELLIPGQNVIARIEYRGVRLDIPYLEGLESKYIEETAKKEEALRKIADINPRSPQQVVAAFHAFGFDRLKSTDAKDRIWIGIKHPLKTALMEYRKVHKIYTTYIKGLVRRSIDGRIYGEFNLNTTETGRLSSADPNLQNIPIPGPHIGGEIRDAFVADEDCTLVSADYTQIEYILAAIFSGDEWLLEQFRNKQRLHKVVASALFGQDYSETEYVKAKSVNFGILYEEGAKALAFRLGISVKAAQKLINDWHAQAPRIKPYQEQIKREIREKGYLTSYYGRKRRFWLITRENWHEVSKEALNFPIQSVASDITLKSLIRLEPMLGDMAHPNITVHDNLTLNVKNEYLEEVAHVTREVMEDTDFAETCPTPVELKIGPSWGRALKEYDFA